MKLSGSESQDRSNSAPVRDSWTSRAPAEAIEELVRRHGARIYRLGLRTCGNPDDAEELVQETFLNAFRRWDSFEGRADPATWLYTIASRACQRMHRRRAGEPQSMLSLDELLPDPDRGVPALATDHEGQLDETVRREAEEAVDRALSTLPMRFRLPLILKEIADFSIAEIADALGVKEATVKTRVHRGRLLLRKALADALPTAPAPPPDHPKEVCLALLQSKQEAMDRGVPFPYPPGELCARCRSLFATLDLAHDACVALRDGELPEAVRSAIERRLRSDIGTI
jgi:RNA polymerase sigma-70 factor, ECF subfamily